MDIDMTALRMVETERGIPLDTLIAAIEEALLVAYHRQPGAIEQARAEIDRKSGTVSVIATEVDEAGTPIGEFDDTPTDFGRIATAYVNNLTKKRIINQPMYSRNERCNIGIMKYITNKS